MASKKSIKKIGKKKKWFDIALPGLLKGEVFSQGFSETPEDLIGRTVKVSLGEAIKSPSKKHISLKLIVDNVKTSVAQTTIKMMEVSQAYLLRKTRKNSKISAKAVGTTTDGLKVDLRLCAITRGHCLSTGKKEIRKLLTEYIVKVIKESKKDAIITNLINNSIQGAVKKTLHKVHPMRTVELEKFKIMSK